jgi:hypothetical protein
MLGVVGRRFIPREPEVPVVEARTWEDDCLELLGFNTADVEAAAQLDLE